MHDADALPHLDYFASLLLAEPHSADPKSWLKAVMEVISDNLSKLKDPKTMKEYAKWAWFLKHFRAGVWKTGETNPTTLRTYGIDLEDLVWPSA